MKGFTREDDYNTRRAHLANLTDEELYNRFWEKMSEVVDPITAMAKKYTSSSIERSVLLRMGFSSVEAQSIVDVCLDHDLMGYGAGHVVYLYSKTFDMELRDAGLAFSRKENINEIIDALEKREADARAKA